jgi:hypothetical protein
MKPILGVLVLVPVMQAFAVAQEPNADAKEGRIYLEGGVGFGVMSMVGPSTHSSGFDSTPEFAAGFAAQYGISDQIAVFTKLGLALGLDDNPGVLGFGMTFDGAYKIFEKKGDAPALSAYAGLGFLHLDIDPKSSVGNGDSDDSNNFVIEFGIQGDFGSGDTWSLQPFFQVQLVPGSRPRPGGLKTYNGVLQIAGGAKLLYKLTDNLFLEPSVTFTGGNFTDSVLFGIGIQLRL